ncbi:hypothetical protein GW17_00051417 [Ensete ventricosum]|nr:hypothetical protein GW17_00051417 [Ensete ventricosum]
MAIIFAPYPSPLPTPCVCVCKFHAHSSFVRLRLQRIHKQSTRKPKHWPRWWVQKQRPSWRSGSCGAHFNDATSTKAQEQKLGVAPYPTGASPGYKKGTSQALHFNRLLVARKELSSDGSGKGQCERRRGPRDCTPLPSPSLRDR